MCLCPLANSLHTNTDAGDYFSAKRATGLKVGQRAICENRRLAHAGLPFYLCNEYAVCYSFVVPGDIPKSNWAGMITEVSGDWDKWSSAAECTVTIHQAQAAGMLFQRGLMEKIVWNSSSLSLLCNLCKALCQHVWVKAACTQTCNTFMSF